MNTIFRIPTVEPNAVEPKAVEPTPPTPPAPPRLSLMQPTKKPLQQILNNYFNSLSDEIKALQHNELPVPDPEHNLPSGAFGYAYKSGNRVVKIINLIKYEYYTEDKVIQNLNNEIVNYYDITKLCPNYFCKFVGYYYGINEGSYKLAIIMEYCGMDLFEYINLLYTLNRKPNKNDLSNYNETFKTIFIQIADALKCLHDNGYVHFDLKTYDGCLDATKDVDVVYHCAASTSNAVDTVVDPLAHVTPNVAMNNFLIDASWRNKVQHYIFLSSNTVYPPKGDKPVVETDFLFDEPYPVYFPVGWMKRYAEVQCELYAKYLPVKMKCTVIRPANLFGPHDKYDFNKCHVTPATIRKVADKMNPIPVWGDGIEFRDLLYI
jgi:serine/threonine protein kinase